MMMNEKSEEEASCSREKRDDEKWTDRKHNEREKKPKSSH